MLIQEQVKCRKCGNPWRVIGSAWCVDCIAKSRKYVIKED